MSKFCKIAEKYIDDVESGRVLVCDYVKKSVRRHLTDLDNAANKGWYFDKKAAEKRMKFISLLKHTKGKCAGTNFILEPWEAFICYCIFGWKSSTGARRFSKAYVEIAKKNGKTAFAAAIADCLLIADGEESADVYCAATKKEQAKICFNQATAFIRKNQDFMDLLKPNFVTNNVSIPSTTSKMEPLGRDSYGLDGINPSGAIIDEYHEWSKDDVRASIESASVGRFQTLIFIITTAGFNKDWPCYQYRKVCLDVLAGIKVQDNVFIAIFTLDEGDDWHDESNWYKANPNLGISVELSKMREQFNDAVVRGGQSEVNFKTKNLNVWVDAPTVWIQDEHFAACNYPKITLELLEGAECYAALDLASHVDINALLLYFPEILPGISAYLAFFWVPESKIEERKDRVDYKLWVELGYIRVMDGNIIDTDKIVSDILELRDQYGFKLAYDPYKAHGGIVQGLIKGGLDAEEDLFICKQDLPTLSEPSKEFEKEVTSHTTHFFENPVMRWMLRNTMIYRDTNDNIRPHKGKSIDKIDGIVAAIMAKRLQMSIAASDEGADMELRTT